MEFRKFFPSRLVAIEKRLLEIDEEKARRKHNLSEDWTEDIHDYIELEDIEYLDVEKLKLETERKFILDRRKRKEKIWVFLMNMMGAMIVAYFTARFTK